MLGGLDFHSLAVAVKRALTAMSAIVSPLTTKGDLLVQLSGALGDYTRQGVGADGKALIADSSSLTGIAYGFHNHGQCQLTKSGANLLLSPFNGNKLIINSKVCTVPDAGVTLAPPAVASTSYYIYAIETAGVVTSLEQSATAPAVQAGTGVKIKTGDATRTLVGQARTTSGNAWVDSATQRFVRSWFNDPGIAGLNTFSADRSTASTSYVEVNTEIRVEFLAWTGEVVRHAINGSCTVNANTHVSNAVGYDGTTAEVGSETILLIPASGNGCGIPIASNKTGLAEGYHYATLLGKVASGTGTWASATSGTTAKVYLHVGAMKGGQ